MQHLAGLDVEHSLVSGTLDDLALARVGHAVGQHERAHGAAAERSRPVRADVAQRIVVAATAGKVGHNYPLFTPRWV